MSEPCTYNRNMEAMREVLRGSLGRSLRSLPDEDRLAAAWPVACGPVLAERAEMMGLDADRVLHVRVLEPAWREQFTQMRTALTGELRRIAGVRLETIHFEQERPASGRTQSADRVENGRTRPNAAARARGRRRDR